MEDRGEDWKTTTCVPSSSSVLAIFEGHAKTPAAKLSRSLAEWSDQNLRKKNIGTFEGIPQQEKSIR